MCLEGKITLSLFPPDYAKSKSTWDNHPDLNIISALLGNNLDTHEEKDSITEQDLMTDSEEEESDISETDDKPVTSNKFNALASYLEQDT